MQKRRFIARLAGLALVAAGLVGPAAPALAAPPGVSPASVSLTLAAGQSADVAKTVTTSAIPPKPDVVLMSDTTGSMDGVIASVRTNLTSIIDGVRGPQPNAQFAVAEYRTSDDPVPDQFKVRQNLTADAAQVQAAVNGLVTGGGSYDGLADWVNAFHQVANGAIAFRPGSSRVLVIVGDIESHDPSLGHTMVQAIAALKAADIRVVAVDVGRLDGTGQATKVTNETGGILLKGTSANVAEKILAGIKAIPATVTPTPVGCPSALVISYDVASRTVDSGTEAKFTETVKVAAGTAPGTYKCTVDFKVNGESAGFIQDLTVVVPGVSINDVSIAEGNGPAKFTVTLSAAASSPISVGYATSNGTATSPADYTAATGTVNFPPGVTSQTITVPIVSDSVDEPNETFTVKLTGTGIADDTGIGTIVDDDRDGGFSCQATALAVAGLPFVRANPADKPCKNDNQSLVQTVASGGVLKLNALNAKTSFSPANLSAAPKAGDNATATAKVDTTTLASGITSIQVGVLQSTASVTCTASGGGLTPVFTGSSTVTSLRINGKPVAIGPGTTTIPLIVGSIKLNVQTKTATSLTQQALVITLPGLNVVLGEAKANLEGTAAHPSGTPCQS